MRDPNTIFTPSVGPPQGPPLSPEIYAAMGEANIFAMCRDFYTELERSPIRALFPQDMEEASKKLAMFLVSAFGGPPLYQQAYGPPRMRARHIPFVIGPKERRIWLGCFFFVLQQAHTSYGFPQDQLDAFRTFLEEFSAWMVNSEV